MRFVVGVIVALNGAVWALQGAYLVEATFMRGPEWIAIGAVVCGLGLFLLATSFAAQARAPAAGTPPSAP